MLAADSVITNLDTWDATTWIAAVAALIALGALVTAVIARLDTRRSSRAGEDSAEASKRSAAASERSAMAGEAAVRASQRSADAADRATAVQEREAAQRRADRYDAAGPAFTPVEEVVIGDELSAEVVLRIDGGPGPMALDIRSAGVPWCDGISGGADIPAGAVWCPPHEPGDYVRFTVHLNTRPWIGHADCPIMLPLSVTAMTDDGQWWERPVRVPLVPAAPPPVGVSNPDPLPEW